MRTLLLEKLEGSRAPTRPSNSPAVKVGLFAETAFR
jgi:hypothetical protein